MCARYHKTTNFIFQTKGVCCFCLSILTAHSRKNANQLLAFYLTSNSLFELLYHFATAVFYYKEVFTTFAAV